MTYNFWHEDSDLYRALRPEWPILVDNDLSSSQPQHNFLPSVPEDPPPVVTQHHQPPPIEGHPHPVHDNPHTSSRSFVCKWNDGHGPCDTTTASVEELVNHVSSSHLPPPGPITLKCKWQGCRLRKLICRNTILRHIRQIDLGINPRRQ
ncbi:uncharacterized protein F5147DRAFT_652526 [Suillus discolor]|uniref:C2H2-type domain-containing protein n=1 Tax=Suillus discolor TaxID=1912936 RepID=A0A9P7F8N8_9AGAM|nr:uncharacterized protein F5147DRAFT_652526 [Suillus discolor]KAG2108939.1 hypothetical protein F5147DRAFT_652526 [Suillus discolor]